MPDTTEHIGFQLWSDGVENWEHRSDFQKLDVRVLEWGPLADRPASAPDGAFWLTTGSGEATELAQYDDTAAEWATRLRDTAAQLIDSPNGQIGTADLPDGESAELAVRVPDGETLTVYAWGAHTVPSGTAPVGLTVQVVLPDGTTDSSANTVWSESVTGVASHTNSSGGTQIMRLRVDNSTGTDYTDSAGNDGVAAQFAYEVA